MEQTYQTAETETDKAELVSEFYYSLSLMQSQAVNYVAFGETEGDKVERILTIIEMVREILKKTGETGLQIRENECPESCTWNPQLGMCICKVT